MKVYKAKKKKPFYTVDNYADYGLLIINGTSSAFVSNWTNTPCDTVACYYMSSDYKEYVEIFEELTSEIKATPTEIAKTPSIKEILGGNKVSIQIE